MRDYRGGSPARRDPRQDDLGARPVDLARGFTALGLIGLAGGRAVEVAARLAVGDRVEVIGSLRPPTQEPTKPR
jgi:hypothetical protein